jgi:hypothetical protein
MLQPDSDLHQNPVENLFGAADDGRRFDDKDAGLPVVPDGAQPNPQHSISRGQFGSPDGALAAELMAESKDLELKRRAAPEGSEKCSEESGQ